MKIALGHESGPQREEKGQKAESQVSTPLLHEMWCMSRVLATCASLHELHHSFLIYIGSPQMLPLWFSGVFGHKMLSS